MNFPANASPPLWIAPSRRHEEKARCFEDSELLFQFGFQDNLQLFELVCRIPQRLKDDLAAFADNVGSRNAGAGKQLEDLAVGILRHGEGVLVGFTKRSNDG